MSSNPPWSNSPAGSPGGPLREDQVTQAVRFLTDPRTRASNASERESFLRQKGLTDSEISAAIMRANPQTVASLHASPYNQAGQSGSAAPLYIPAPIMEEPILWSAVKSIFGAVGAMAIGVIGYHMYVQEGKPSGSSSSSVPREELHASFQSEGNGNMVTEERLNSVIKELTAAQELRHKELLFSIRDLSQALTEVKGRRKLGGSVVLPDSEVHVAEAPSTSELPCDVPLEVAKLIEAGLDSVVQLVLSSLNKKLNKSNQKFKKLEGSALLRFCGYKETESFFTLEEVRQSNVDSVLSEIQNQRQRTKSSDPVTIEAPQESPPSRPWITAEPKIVELE